jgi:hypothetical protein
MVDENFESWLSTHEPWQWLGSTRRLQEEVYGFKYEELNGAALADYVTWNVVALEAEVHEFLDEVQWKTWAKNRGHVEDRAAAIEELVDVGHFLANLASGLGVTDDEWQLAYRNKQIKNAARQNAKGGYGREQKCPSCRRALDAPNATYTRMHTSTGRDMMAIFCARCDTLIAEETYGVIRENKKGMK